MYKLEQMAAEGEETRGVVLVERVSMMIFVKIFLSNESVRKISGQSTRQTMVKKNGKQT
jgi:hypothetical protein